MYLLFVYIEAGSSRAKQTNKETNKKISVSAPPVQEKNKYRLEFTAVLEGVISWYSRKQFSSLCLPFIELDIILIRIARCVGGISLSVSMNLRVSLRIRLLGRSSAHIHIHCYISSWCINPSVFIVFLVFSVSRCCSWGSRWIVFVSVHLYSLRLYFLLVSSVKISLVGFI